MCKDDLPDLPEFLKLSAEARAKAWEGKTLISVNASSVTETRHEDAGTIKLRAELEAQRKAKQAERFAYLKEQAAERKRLGVKPIKRR